MSEAGVIGVVLSCIHWNTMAYHAELASPCPSLCHDSLVPRPHPQGEGV